MEFMNLVCLVIWIAQFIFGIMAACGKATVHPVVFICAVIVCILHYLEEIV